MNDKVKHALAGALVGTFAYTLTGAMLAMADMNGFYAWPAPFVAALIAGLVKEKADHDDNKITPQLHSVEPADVLATAAPGALLSALAFAWV